MGSSTAGLAFGSLCVTCMQASSTQHAVHAGWPQAPCQPPSACNSRLLPAGSWAAYVAGALVVLMHECEADFSREGLSILVHSGEGWEPCALPAHVVPTCSCTQRRVRAVCLPCRSSMSGMVHWLARLLQRCRLPRLVSRPTLAPAYPTCMHQHLTTATSLTPCSTGSLWQMCRRARG